MWGRCGPVQKGYASFRKEGGVTKSKRNTTGRGAGEKQTGEVNDLCGQLGQPVEDVMGRGKK